jgi:hypothetical protein
MKIDIDRLLGRLGVFSANSGYSPESFSNTLVLHKDLEIRGNSQAQVLIGDPRKANVEKSEALQTEQPV